jgi:hypothetical protein
MRRADNSIVFGPSAPPESHRLADDLIDERAYMNRPERGLAFIAVSLTLIGVAAAGTYFVVGSRPRSEPAVVQPQPVSTTTITRAEIPAPTPVPTVTPADLPWDSPQVDAVHAPRLAKPLPAPQVMPTERPQAVTSPAQTTPRGSEKSRDQMTDDAIKRAGFPHGVPAPPERAEPTPPDEATGGYKAPGTLPPPEEAKPQNLPAPELDQYEIKR